MQVKIVKPFSMDTPSGRVPFETGQVVPNGQKNWIEKGLAVEDGATKHKDEKL